MAKLIKIKINIDIKPLYDIEVKDNHNFIVNDGIVIKNSEQYLDNLGNCCLSSLNCEVFYDKENKFDIKKLERVAESICRFLDNVVEYEIQNATYAVKEQKDSLIALRRIGAGITNISALLFLNNMEYGSEEGNKLIEQFVDVYNYNLYKYSIKLGKEKGSFAAFSKEKYIQSGFIKNLIKRHPDLEFNEMRNVCISSIAPTGSISLLISKMIMSYGIEPPFGLYYWKRTRISGKYEYYFCVPSVVRKAFLNNGIDIGATSDTIKDDWAGTQGKKIAKLIDDNKHKLGIKLKTDKEIKTLDKLNFMAGLQKNIDSSISVTYMLPENSDWKDVYNLILEAYKKEVKSIAAFPDKKMYGIVTSIPFKELANKLLLENVEIHHQNFDDLELKELNMSRDNIKPSVQHVERLTTLDADIYVVTVKGEKYCVVIGLQNNFPYEIFGGHLNGLGLKTNYKRGKITKVKKNQYSLEFDDICIDDFSKQFTPTEQILFRMASLSLRQGTPINIIVEQLQKATEDITSMASAAARVLKKYIKDGEKVGDQKCPHCGSQLVYLEGCCSCAAGCGYSKCS